MLGALTLGCSSDGDLPPYRGGEGPSSRNYKAGPCEAGAEYRCSATLEQGNGLLSCWQGTQQCVDGVWGPCVGGLTTQVDPRHHGPPGGLRTLALSEPVECVDNPCDPGCQVFHEDPEDISAPPGTGGEIPDWESPPGTAPCEHQLCDVGTALNPSCHPCVATVCAVDASCCTTAWTEACAELVRTECESTPQPPPVSVCDYTLFSTTTLTGGGNQGIMVGGPVGAADAGGVGDRAVDLGRVTVDEVVSGGGVFLDATDVKGTVSANGKITCQNNPVIGDESIGRCGMTDDSSVEFPEIPTRSVSCITPSATMVDVGGVQTFHPGETRRINIASNTAQVILSGPGDYAHVNFNADGTLIFAQPGVYTFNTLYLGGNTPKVLVPPTGTVNIDTCANLHFDNGTQTYTWNYDGSTYTPGPRPDPFAVQWYTAKVCSGSEEVKLGPGAIASGVLIAPYCKVHIYSGNNIGTVEGLVYAHALQLEPGVHIDATNLVGEACRDAGIGEEPPSCPTLDIPEFPPVLNEPCRSGLDCQVNTRCTDVATDPACDHSKCLLGEALDAGCDPCVARICAEDPSCCTEEWSASCVAKVKTVCDAWCGSVTGCTHPVCDVGGPLTAGCSDCATTVCSTPGREYCCTTAWDAACVASAHTLCGGAPPPPEFFACDYALMVGNDSNGLDAYGTTIRGNVRLGTAESSINAEGFKRSQVDGDVHALGSFTLSNSDVSGGVQVAGTWNNAGGSVGAPPVGSSPLNHALPTKTLTCPTGGANQTFTNHATLAPGTYGDVQVNNWGSNITLTLQAGTYNLRSLRLAADTRLQLPATGTVEINVCGSVRFEQQTQILGLSGGADPLRLQVYSASTDTNPWNCDANAICIENQASLGGVFSAPGGGVYLGNGARLYGQLRGAMGRLRPDSVLDASGTTGDACRAVMSTCPVETPDPTVGDTGECVANAAGFTDPSCAAPDLAVGMPCGAEIPVCNHGTVDAPAGAVLTFYPRSGQQFATTSPDPAWAVGTCTVTAPIPAGTCVEQPCDPALLDEELTILVNGNGAVPECSGLDNWSLYPNTTCGGDPIVVTEIYEATCPYASSALWGLLAWEATTPGGSRVTWSGRTATTEEGLAAASWMPLGVAASTPTDTQSCPLTSELPGCPVDVTQALWDPGPQRRNQPAFLELRIEVESSGADLATLHDWKVTYSCVHDE